MKLRELQRQFQDSVREGQGPPIYAEAYLLRLLSTLGETFPAIRKILGEKSFSSLIAAYLRAHPSRYFGIQSVGQWLPVFVRRHEVSRGRPFLAELAALEWRIFEAFYTEDLEPLSPEDAERCAQEQAEKLCLALHPSVDLFHSGWNLDELWFRPAEARARPVETALLIYRQGTRMRL